MLEIEGKLHEQGDLYNIFGLVPLPGKTHTYKTKLRNMITHDTIKQTGHLKT